MEKKYYFKRLLCVLLTCFLLINLVACNAKKEEVNTEKPVVKIGFVLDFSGENAEDAMQMYKAAEMAVEEINAAGGVLTEGLMLELVQKDDKGESLSSAAAYYQFEEEGICAVIGTDNLDGLKSITDIAQRVNIPIITPSITANEITQGANFSFQSCYKDSYIAKAVAEFAQSKIGVKKVAVAYNPADEYSVFCYDDFVMAAEAAGLEIVYAGNFNPEDEATIMDMWNSINTTNAETVFIPTDMDVFVDKILKSAKECGYKGTFLGTDKYHDISGDTYGYKVYMPYNMSVLNTDEDTAAFIEEFCSKYSLEANSLCDGIRPAYEAVYFIRDAIEKGYLATPVSIALKLPFLMGTTRLGDYEIEAYGNVTKSIDFEAMVDGESSFEGTVFK